ncbi:MAG: bifunctional riboflavin kinase/FAD synthetase [Bacteroidota bacterium]
MIVVRTLDDIALNGNSVVTVGTYDGIHLGHQQIFREVVTRAQKRNAKSVFVTFEPHPKEVIQQKPIRLLTTLNERVEQFRQWLPDVIWVVNFTYDFSRLSPKEFYEKYIVKNLRVAEVVEGYDHMFGRDRKAGIEELQAMGKEFQFDVHIVSPVMSDGTEVSSTKIRHLLDDGNVTQANKFLGRAYTFSGEIIHGDGRGVTIGFPTANIKVGAMNKLIPAGGVYTVRAIIDGLAYYGMMNIGTNPTFSENGTQSFEVHLFNTDKDFYTKEITIQLLKRLRAEKKFSTAEELVAQLHNDKEESLHLITNIH